MSETDLKENLELVLDEFELVGVVYAGVDGKNIIKIGDLEKLTVIGLVQTLFGGEVEIKKLYKSLEGQILPQGWGQGKARCYVDVTTNAKIFGVFNILKKGEKFENLQRKRIFMDKFKNMLEKYAK